MLHYIYLIRYGEDISLGLHSDIGLDYCIPILTYEYLEINCNCFFLAIVHLYKKCGTIFFFVTAFGYGEFAA
jgi:hypothetical protein